MKNIDQIKQTADADYFLDITSETCPMTFVRTKLLIEKMAPGETAMVRLQGAEPLANVPRSVRESGHQVLFLRPEDDHGPAERVHRLLLRKG